MELVDQHRQGEGEKGKVIAVSTDHKAISHSHGTSDTWLPAFVKAEDDTDTHGHRGGWFGLHGLFFRLTVKRLEKGSKDVNPP